MEERYGDHDGYVAAVEAAVADAVEQGFLLPADADTLIEQAAASNVLRQSSPGATQAPTDLDIDALKREVFIDVDSRRDFTRQMVDMIFSFGELGFQEVETSRVITGAARSRWPRRSRTRERR